MVREGITKDFHPLNHPAIQFHGHVFTVYDSSDPNIQERSECSVALTARHIPIRARSTAWVSARFLVYDWLGQCVQDPETWRNMHGGNGVMAMAQSEHAKCVFVGDAGIEPATPSV